MVNSSVTTRVLHCYINLAHIVVNYKDVHEVNLGIENLIKQIDYGNNQVDFRYNYVIENYCRSVSDLRLKEAVYYILVDSVKLQDHGLQDLD